MNDGTTTCYSCSIYGSSTSEAGESTLQKTRKQRTKSKEGGGGQRKSKKNKETTEEDETSEEEEDSSEDPESVLGKHEQAKGVY